MDATKIKTWTSDSVEFAKEKIDICINNAKEKTDTLLTQSKQLSQSIHDLKQAVDNVLHYAEEYSCHYEIKPYKAPVELEETSDDSDSSVIERYRRLVIKKEMLAKVSSQRVYY
uniref:Uncharacterized protein n=1 Tax=Photinus pyralis TaxID=7054 RepID=A0A1Y1MGD8_PHOPY